MKENPVKRNSLAFAMILVLAVSVVSAAAEKTKLPERYRKWLEEDAVYIITSTERSVFLKLTTDRERDLFIDAFWKHRDPTPDSDENEFKTEHFRRINYANQYLGRDATVPGWRTDRGRMYVLLGEPQEIQRFTGKSGLYDTETWFYQGKTDAGLPAGFYLIFFREHGNGTLRLYSPAHDGPMALMATYTGDPADYTKAYEALRDIEPGLAEVVINPIPGEQSAIYGRASMATDLLIQKIETLPSRTVQERYAQKFLQYKDLVEVEYSANYIDCDSLIKVFRDPSGLYFVHYAIEPQRLSVNQYQKKYYTTLKVNGRVTTLDGRLVHQFDKTVPLELGEEQMRDVSRTPFDFHDLFPLVPGDYRVSILLKNEVSKEFMSVEQAVRIPQAGAAVELTQPLLGYKMTRLDAGPRKMKAFRVGPYQLYCQPNRVFTAKDTLEVLFQLNNLSPEAAAGATVRTAFFRDGGLVREIVRKPSDYPDLPDALEEVPLASFAPAHYKVQVSLLRNGAEVVSAAEEFDLTYAEAVGRPWQSSRVLPDPSDPVYDQIVGAQLFFLGRLDEARACLERAYQRKPDAVGAAEGLAKVCGALGDYARVIEVLSPLFGRAEPPAYGAYVLLGDAYRKSGQPEKAVAVLEQAVSHYGVNATVMNAMGEAYLGMGKNAEALAAFQKSLELSADQPDIVKKIEAIKKKK